MEQKEPHVFPQGVGLPHRLVEKAGDIRAGDLEEPLGLVVGVVRSELAVDGVAGEAPEAADRPRAVDERDVGDRLVVGDARGDRPKGDDQALAGSFDRDGFGVARRVACFFRVDRHRRARIEGADPEQPVVVGHGSVLAGRRRDGGAFHRDDFQVQDDAHDERTGSAFQSGRARGRFRGGGDASREREHRGGGEGPSLHGLSSPFRRIQRLWRGAPVGVFEA